MSKIVKEKECKDCVSEDEYLMFHRFDVPKRECGKCIANKVLKGVSNA